MPLNSEICRLRLGEVLEKCDARLGPTATGDFSRSTLLQLVFIVTGMKPTLKMSYLRVKCYTGLCERLQQATVRRMSRWQETVDVLVEDLTAEKIERCRRDGRFVSHAFGCPRSRSLRDGILCRVARGRKKGILCQAPGCGMDLPVACACTHSLCNKTPGVESASPGQDTRETARQFGLHRRAPPGVACRV